MKAKASSAASKKQKQPAVPSANQTLQALAEKIKMWRKRHEMTQADLALRSNISVSFISMIERGERSPSYETLVELAKALDIPLSELFRTEEQAPADDGYYRRLIEFAQGAHLSRKQVEQFIQVGSAMFDRPDVAEPRKAPVMNEVKAPPGRRCSVPGCDRPLLARGLCPSHYRRKLRQTGGR